MTSKGVLIRYGAIREVARFAHDFQEPLERGTEVVVQSHRGLEMGVLLESIPPTRLNGNYSGNGHQAENSAPTPTVRMIRRASDEDLACQKLLRENCEKDFPIWQERITEWKLQLQLIDTEWTLDRQKLILYVLNERGPECTKLALAAAAAGLGVIEVQPVTSDGILDLQAGPVGGGCGSGGCGCGSE